jgi:hypothetical protein
MSPQSDRGKAVRDLHEIERAMARWTMWVAIFTGLLVVASVVSNLFIYLQYYTASNVQAETREQLRAVVANTANLIVLPDDPGAPGGLVVVIPTFQNFGGTRTNSFKAVINLKFFEGAIPNNLDVSKPYLKVESREVVIAPNSSFQGIQVGMPAEDLVKAKDGRGEILFWGSAEYSDIFQPKKIHHISMCVLLKPQQATGVKIGIQPIPYRPDCNQND